MEMAASEERNNSAMSSMTSIEIGAEAQAQCGDEEMLKKAQLRKCYDYIMKEIDAKDLMHYMFSKKALTGDDLDEIENTQPPTRKTRAEVLLRMVECKISMYDVFVEALSKSCPHVEKKLKGVEIGPDDLIYCQVTTTIPKFLQMKIESAKKVFVKTETFGLVKSALEDTGYVMITGGPGSGKTMMALMLMEEYRRKYALFFIDNLENFDLNKMFEIKEPKLLVVDDVLGSVSTTLDKVYSFNKHFDLIEDMLQNSNSPPESVQDDFHSVIRVIFTSKTWLINEGKSYVKQHLSRYLTESVFDLSKSKMTTQERENMLSKHCKNKGKSISSENISKICSDKEEQLLGFPYVCQLFSSMQTIKDPVQFFRHPMTFLKTELTSLFKADKMKKACFMLMVLCDGKFSLGSITDEKVKLIQDSIGTIEQFCNKVENTAEILKDTFFKIEDDTVSFMHGSIFDTAAYLLGSENLSFVIEHCSMAVINERIRVGSSVGSEFEITVNEPNYPLLSRRLAQELCNGEFSVCLSHQAFGNQKVRTQIFDIISESGKLNDLIHSYDRNHGAHFMFWVAFFDHPHLLTKTLSLDRFSTEFSTEELLWGILATCINGKDVHFDKLTSKNDHIKNLLPQKTIEDITKSEDEEQANKFQNYFKLTSYSLEFKGTCGLIHVAAAFGRTIIVKRLLKTGVDVDMLTESGVTPLMLAALHGHIELVQMLIEEGADYKRTSTEGNCSLHFACLGNQTKVIEELCKLDLNINCQANSKWTPLLYSCRYGDLTAVDLLLSKSADKTLTTSTGLTCLHLACCSGNVNIVQRFLHDKDVDVNCEARSLMTPLMYACFEGHTNIVKKLLDKHADISKTDASRRTCLHYACYRSDNCNLIKMLLQCKIDIDCKDKEEFTPLCYASRYGNVEIVKLLIENGADTQVQTCNGLNCLHLSTMGNVQMVKTFLCQNLDIESKSKLNETPLLYACINGCVKIVKYLIDKDADTDACDDYKRNALHLACKSGHLQVAEHLIELGMDINEKDEKEWTPVMYASRFGTFELVNILLSKGAKLDVSTNTGLNCLHLACCDGNEDKVKLLSTKGLNVNSRTHKEKTPLIYCCDEGNTSLIDVLIAEGADQFAVDNTNRNCLHYACLNKCNEEMLLKLINEHGMDVNTKGENEWTPILFLSRYGSWRFVERLIDLHADTKALSKSGHNCLHLAACNGNQHMVEMFLGMDFHVNSKTYKNKTPLMYATEFGKKDVAQLLISKSADVFATDVNGKNCYDWLDKDKFQDLAQMLQEKYPELLIPSTSTTEDTSNS